MAEVMVRFNGRGMMVPVDFERLAGTKTRTAGPAPEQGPRFGALYGVLAVDDCGIVVSVNGAAERIFEATSAQLVGQSIATLLPAALDEGVSIDWLACEVSQLVGLRCDVLGLTPKRRSVPLHMTIRRLQRDGRRLLAVILRELTASELRERGYRKGASARVAY